MTLITMIRLSLTILFCVLFQWSDGEIPLPRRDTFYHFTAEPYQALDDPVPLERGQHPIDYYRLPEGIRPETYKLRITPFLEEGNFSFVGDVEIRFSVLESRRDVVLHSKELAISEERVVEEGSGVPLEIDAISHDHDRDFHEVRLKEPLVAGGAYVIAMKFAGVLNDDLNGFYRSSYKDDDGKIHWLAVTQFAATSARKAFPCFDEPHLKANFTISIGRHMEMSSLSNMPAVGPPEHDPMLPENFVWDHYAESPKMSTYLVAFVVSKFKSKRVADGEFSTWSRGDAVDQVDYSLTVGPKVLDIMYNITKIRYALPKMDLIGIPDFEAGAMENWGLVTFRETALLYENGTSTPFNKQRVATVVTHELAHQWFGDLVSPEWWKFTWLNEGFATFFECAAADFVSSAQFNYGSDIQLFASMDDQLKADSMVPENINVTEVMISWTKQSGYPVVTVMRNYDGSTLIIKQARFVLDEAFKDNKIIWWIPLTFTTGSTMDFAKTTPNIWLSEHGVHHEIKGLVDEDWVMFNIQGSGYYRVNYDEHNWKLITNFMLGKDFHKVHPVNRAQLIDDSLNLARGGLLRYSVALNLIRYMEQETDFIPWYSLYPSLAFLDSRLKYSEEYPRFKMLMSHLMLKYYQSLNFTDSPQDDHLALLSRSMLLPWACKYKNEECVEEAHKIFADWKLGKIDRVPPNIKGTVYCHGISSGDKEDWDFLWNKYLSSTVATEQAIIIGALGCSKDKNILERFLGMACDSDSGIRQHEKTSVFAAVFNSPDGLEVALEYLIRNFEKVKGGLGTASVGGLLKSLSNRISSPQQATKTSAMDLKVTWVVTALFCTSLTAAVHGEIRYESVALSKAKLPKIILRTFVAEDPKHPEYYRLPKGVIPETYHLKIVPFFEKGNFSFYGVVEIRFNVLDSTDILVLHVKDLQITTQKVMEDDQEGKEIPIKDSVHMEQRDFHMVTLEHAMLAGKNYKATMSFQGRLRDDLNGFYRSSYKDANGKLR
ncbi:aminopeptidase N-like [Ischnura elegans]|uniref:aminopeptidase N-like n=1 Tax=Ischnura elegans TaxID=197161 RepID=UPI001ED8A7B2|nr:aminopeptidase N-like [Ischnura elegans]